MNDTEPAQLALVSWENYRPTSAWPGILNSVSSDGQRENRTEKCARTKPGSCRVGVLSFFNLENENTHRVKTQLTTVVGNSPKLQWMVIMFVIIKSLNGVIMLNSLCPLNTTMCLQPVSELPVNDRCRSFVSCFVAGFFAPLSHRKSNAQCSKQGNHRTHTPCFLFVSLFAVFFPHFYLECTILIKKVFIWSILGQIVSHTRTLSPV